MHNVKNYSQSQSIISHYLIKLRNKEAQKNSYLFRKNIKLMGTLLAYEASKMMEIYSRSGAIYIHYPIVVNILRAGNPFVEGVLEVFRQSRVDFFGVSRDEKTLESTIYYEKTHNHNYGILIIPDVMIATGASLEVVINRLLKLGSPEKIIILNCISHMDGIKRINTLHNNISFFTCAIDPMIDGKGYIVPGLGDAGDLCYGN